MSDYQGLIEGRITGDEAVSMVKAGAKDLDAFLESKPGMEDLLANIIGQRVGGEIHAETWQLLGDSLVGFLGPDLAEFIGWILVGEAIGDTSRIEMLAAHAPPRTTAAIRSALGQWTVELREAWSQWRQIPNDWRTIFRDVYHDQILNSPFIRIRILKYNGEEMLLEGHPNSFLNLARNLALTLQLVGNPDIFAPDVVESFVEEVARLNKLIMPEEELEGSTGAEDEEETPGDKSG